MKIKFTIHPLFIGFGFYYAFSGRIFEFVIYTLTAVIHELGHSIIANGIGYRLNKIVLMPFGAVATGNIEGIKPSDECAVALAGPVVNLFVGIFFVALWWVFPEVYPLTESVATANFTLGTVNLIPAYPLDGGRIVYALLRGRFGEDKSRTVCKTAGLLLGLILFGLFVATIFKTVNFSLLFFSLFILFGAFSGKKENAFIKIYSGINRDKLLRGVEIKRQAVDENITIGKLMKILDADSINELTVYKDNKPYVKLGQSDLERIIEKASVYGKLKDYTDT